MKTLSVLSVSILFCSSICASEPTLKAHIQFDGRDYQFLTSDVKEPNSIFFYAPSLAMQDKWSSEVAIGRIVSNDHRPDCIEARPSFDACLQSRCIGQLERDD